MLPIAYQIYSAREQAEENLEKVLSVLKDIGYEGVEFAGFYGKSYEEINQLIKKYELIPLSSHVSLDEVSNDPFGVLAFHKKIGCEYIVIPYLDENHRPGGFKFSKAIREIYQFSELCKKAKIKLLYHNHDFEFNKISDQYGLDFLLDSIDEKLLYLEMDTCWVHYAGEDPIGYLKKYAGRCPIIHIKDYVGGSKESFMYKPLGEGINDIAGIVKASEKIGVEWLVVEMDDSPEMHPFKAAKKCYEYLNTL